MTTILWARLGAKKWFTESAAFIPPVRTFSSNYIPHSESLMMHEDNHSRQKLNTAQLTEQITFMSDVMKLTSLRVNNERGRG